MRILVLSQYYPPEDRPITPSVARGLSERGHDVRVLTGYPNYPEGKLYDGYQQRWRKYERDEGINILRVPLIIDHSQNPIKRSLNYFSFGLSSATARRFARGADVIYVYATQMTPALGPWLWESTGGAPYVLHVQDLWPDSITGSSLVGGGRASRIIDTTLSPWIRNVYRRAGAVIGIAPTMVSTLIERGAPADQTHLVYNWADEPENDISIESRITEASTVTRILYAGNIGDMQDLETAVRAARISQSSGIELTILGEGVALSRIQELVSSLGATNVHFYGRVPREEMDAFYRAADYALISLKDLRAFRGTIPSKFQAALANGVPVISNVQGDLRGLVDSLRVGFTADAEDADSLASAFKAAASTSPDGRLKQTELARQAHRDHFSLHSGIDSIERILLEAAQREGHRKRRAAPNAVN